MVIEKKSDNWYRLYNEKQDTRGFIKNSSQFHKASYIGLKHHEGNKKLNRLYIINRC